MVEGYPIELDVQRVMNLVTGFGWEKVKEEVIGQDVVVTIKKTVLSEETVVPPAPPS